MKRILEVAHEYGNVTAFKAYLELGLSMSMDTRSELHCAGVSLIDCPHNGRKDVVDMTLVGDILLPLCQTFVLILSYHS